MRRWVVMAALLLAMGAALPARADDTDDCYSDVLIKTDPAGRRRLAAVWPTMTTLAASIFSG